MEDTITGLRPVGAVLVYNRRGVAALAGGVPYLRPRDGESCLFESCLDKVGAVMDVEDFRRIALSLEGAQESSHMGSPDFRVGGRIFATLAAQKQGYGNLMLTAEQQAAFVEELPEVFVPVAGGWGRNGATHLRLAAANEDVVTGALRAAWKIRLAKNGATGRKKNAAKMPAKKRS
jgi:hypothetical protein